MADEREVCDFKNAISIITFFFHVYMVQTLIPLLSLSTYLKKRIIQQYIFFNPVLLAIHINI